MCLGLEMLRGGDIRLLDKDVRVSHRGDEAGDGVVLVETPTDVRVYVDERCPETVSWFERTFCAKGREGRGIKLDVAGEQVIIFASYPDLSGAKGATTVTPLQRPPLTLFLGRAAPLKTRKPRPDDPMPREETFFAARLRESNFRRTTSLPVLSFDLPSSKSKHPPKPPLVRTTSRPSKKAKEKERHVQGLLSGKDPPKATTTDKGKARAVPPLPPPLARSASSHNLLPPPPLGPKRPRPPPTESGDLFSTTTSSSRRPSTSSSSLSRRRRIIPPSDSSSSEDEAGPGGIGDGLPASPTPSVATTFGGGLEDEGDERKDVVMELGGFNTGAGGVGKRKPMSRSTSAPVGAFAKLLANKPQAAGGGEREKSVGPEVTVEGRNKATLKKILLGRLVDRGVGREHDDFRDVFSLSLKGVQYALRMTFQTTLLDRPRATQLVDRHLDMYITSPALVKIEEGEGEGAHHGRTGTGGILPSPESLEASGA